jgi:hypothetical protein
MAALRTAQETTTTAEMRDWLECKVSMKMLPQRLHRMSKGRPMRKHGYAYGNCLFINLFI